MATGSIKKSAILSKDIVFTNETPTSSGGVNFVSRSLFGEGIPNGASLISAVFERGTMFGCNLRLNLYTNALYVETPTTDPYTGTIRVYYLALYN